MYKIYFKKKNTNSNVKVMSRFVLKKMVRSSELMAMVMTTA